jgi:HPt (histidine-containing phosphotransfer) domain-containing protein
LGNQTLAESLLQKFQIRVESDFEQLELGIATGDADAVRKFAHGLKGAAANLSAEGVRRAVARLELLADENDLGEAIVCLEVLKLEWDRCQIFMPTLAQLS